LFENVPIGALCFGDIVFFTKKISPKLVDLKILGIDTHGLSKQVVGIVKALQFTAGHSHPGYIFSFKNKPSIIIGDCLQVMSLGFRPSPMQGENFAKLNQASDAGNLLSNERL
jgi:hypothetical protein